MKIGLDDEVNARIQDHLNLVGVRRTGLMHVDGLVGISIESLELLLDVLDLFVVGIRSWKE